IRHGLAAKPTSDGSTRLWRSYARHSLGKATPAYFLKRDIRAHSPAYSMFVLSPPSHEIFISCVIGEDRSLLFFQSFSNLFNVRLSTSGFSFIESNAPAPGAPPAFPGLNPSSSNVLFFRPSR